MPAENVGWADCRRMAFTSGRLFRLSIASAISFIRGMASTLCGGLSNVSRAIKFETSNWMYLKPGATGWVVSPPSLPTAGVVAIIHLLLLNIADATADYGGKAGREQVTDGKLPLTRRIPGSKPWDLRTDP